MDPYSLEPSRQRRFYDRAAATYQQEAVLAEAVRRDLFERLSLTALRPKTVLDLGCAVGASIPQFAKIYPEATVVGLDFSHNMLTQAARQKSGFWLMGLFEKLPLADNSVDLVFSNLALHCVNDLDICLAEVCRVLKPDGLFSFSTFGPSTLGELRQAWSTGDEFVHVHRFLDMHDVGDALIRAGFSEPVLDVDTLTLNYQSPRAAMQDLKRIGEGNTALGRPRGLTGKRLMNEVLEACQQFQRADQRFHLSFELVFGQAWGVSEINQTKYQDGDVHIPISQIRRR